MESNGLIMPFVYTTIFFIILNGDTDGKPIEETRDLDPVFYQTETMPTVTSPSSGGLMSVEDYNNDYYDSLYKDLDYHDSDYDYLRHGDKEDIDVVDRDVPTEDPMHSQVIRDYNDPSYDDAYYYDGVHYDTRNEGDGDEFNQSVRSDLEHTKHADSDHHYELPHNGRHITHEDNWNLLIDNDQINVGNRDSTVPFGKTGGLGENTKQEHGFASDKGDGKEESDPFSVDKRSGSPAYRSDGVREDFGALSNESVSVEHDGNNMVDEITQRGHDSSSVTNLNAMRPGNQEYGQTNNNADVDGNEHISSSSLPGQETSALYTDPGISDSPQGVSSQNRHEPGVTVNVPLPTSAQDLNVDFLIKPTENSELGGNMHDSGFSLPITGHGNDGTPNVGSAVDTSTFDNSFQNHDTTFSKFTDVQHNNITRRSDPTRDAITIYPDINDFTENNSNHHTARTGVEYSVPDIDVIDGGNGNDHSSTPIIVIPEVEISTDDIFDHLLDIDDYTQSTIAEIITALNRRFGTPTQKPQSHSITPSVTQHNFASDNIFSSYGSISITVSTDILSSVTHDKVQNVPTPKLEPSATVTLMQTVIPEIQSRSVIVLHSVSLPSTENSSGSVLATTPEKTEDDKDNGRDTTRAGHDHTLSSPTTQTTQSHSSPETSSTSPSSHAVGSTGRSAGITFSAISIPTSPERERRPSSSLRTGRVLHGDTTPVHLPTRNRHSATVPSSSGHITDKSGEETSTLTVTSVSSTQPHVTTELIDQDRPSSFLELKFRMSWTEFCDHEMSIRSELVDLIHRHASQCDVTHDQIQVLNQTAQCAHVNAIQKEIIVQMYMTNMTHHYDRSLTIECAEILKTGLRLGDNSIIITKLITINFHDSLETPDDDEGKRPIEGGRTETQSFDPMDDPGIRVAIILSVVSGCCCVGIMAIQIFGRRRLRSSNNLVSSLNRSSSMTSGDDSIQLSSVCKSLSSSGVLNMGLDLLDPPDPTHPLNLVQLSNFCMEEKNINIEFQRIPNRIPRISVVPVGEDDKNRYANILPLATTRVKLHPEGLEPRSTYINASFVTGPDNQCQYYIATQAPTDDTVPDFWTMVWQQRTSVIIMLTQMEEDGQTRCAPYWPELTGKSAVEKYGDFHVELKQKEVHQEYIISRLELNNIRRIERREIVHYWYTCWPVKSLPEPISLVKLILDTRPSYENGLVPVVVHCSPGTGRTCTLIALDLCMRQFEIRRIVDVMKTVNAVRQERAGAIQNKEQYSLIYQAVNEYASIVVSPVVSAASSATTLHALLPS